MHSCGDTDLRHRLCPLLLLTPTWRPKEGERVSGLSPALLLGNSSQYLLRMSTYCLPKPLTHHPPQRNSPATERHGPPNQRKWASPQGWVARLPGSQLGAGLGRSISLPHSTLGRGPAFVIPDWVCQDRYTCPWQSQIPWHMPIILALRRRRIKSSGSSLATQQL